MDLLIQFTNEVPDKMPTGWETVNTDNCQSRRDIIVKALTPRIEQRPAFAWLQIGSSVHPSGCPVCVERFKLDYA